MERNDAQIKTTLKKLLQQEVSSANALLQSLSSESTALASLDEKLITINSANKQKLISSLQLASKNRMNFMIDSGLATNSIEIKEYHNSSDLGTEISDQFVTLSKIARQCFEENRQIGQLINRRSQFITKALGSLSPTANLQKLTYEANGSTESSSSSGSKPYCSV